MSHLKGRITLTEQDLYTSSADKLHTIGTIADGSKGRLFRYVLAGGSSLVAGNTLQESAEDTTMENMVIPTAGVAGDNYINVTNGTGTITSAMYEGGTISVYTSGTSLIGEEYLITKVTGPAAGMTSGVALKVYIDRPLRKAIAVTATVNMKRSPWSGVIQSTGTTASGMPVGVAIYPITNAQYGWVLTHGEGNVLCDGTTMAVGSDLALSVTVAGASGLYAVTSGRARIGYARQANASGKGITAFLQID